MFIWDAAEACFELVKCTCKNVEDVNVSCKLALH